jgi:hypothetical protein
MIALTSSARGARVVTCRFYAFTSWTMTITHEKCRETATRPHLPLGGLATDLATEHGGTDANKRDAVRQGGRLNVADVQL